jgi:hypothetical protein
VEGDRFVAVNLDTMYDAIDASTMIQAPQVEPVEVSAVAALEAEALIREARVRQKRRHRFVALAVAAALAISASSYVIANGTGRSGGPASGGHGIQAATVKAFVGTWNGLGDSDMLISIKSDGRGTATWPELVRCGTGVGKGPPPCDTWIPGTVIGPDGARITTWHIIVGGRASIRLTKANGTLANGVVTSSTDLSRLGDGPATFRISSSNDLLHVTASWDEPHSILGPFCGARDNKLPYEKQLAIGIPGPGC